MTTTLLLMKCVVIFFTLFPISFNALGIYLIFSTKSMSNSKFLLINLASSEILLCGSQMAYYSASLIPGSKERELPIAYKIALMCAFYYYLSMFLMTIDRLVAILFPLKYRVTVTKTRLFRMVLAIWFLALVLEVSLFLSKSWSGLVGSYFWVSLDVTYFILFCVTYGLILFRIKSRRRFENNLPETATERRHRFAINRERKFFKIVALIIVSFIILIMIPNIVHRYIDSAPNELLKAFISLVWVCSFIADPIIYIFLQDDLRLLLRSKFCCFNQTIEEVPSHQEFQQETAL